jgi:hypothetical protein
MSKIEFHTSVDEIVECDDIPSFLIKKVNLGKNDFWTPLRTIYLGADIPSDLRSKILELTERKSTLFEINRTIYLNSTYDAINRAIQESDDERIKSILKVNEKLSRENIFISLSFSDFPTIKMDDNFEELLDYVYAFSSVLFVPHVRYGETKTTVKYSARDFCKYVDGAIKILNEKNAKPIFVPFDINYDKATRDEILRHYAEKGYTNIWIDFKGKVFSKTMIARMRTLWRLINRMFGESAENVVIYLANIKKTPRETPIDFKVAPSDFIGVFSYGDIVGTPWKGILYLQPSEDEAYWEKKGYSSKREYEIAIFKRDCSIFENSTYYYYHPDKIKFDNNKLDRIRKGILQLGLSKKHIAERVSYSVSGLIALNEIDQLKRKVIEEGKLLDYIETKEFFKERGCSILEELKTSKKVKGVEKSIFDFI